MWLSDLAKRRRFGRRPDLYRMPYNIRNPRKAVYQHRPTGTYELGSRRKTVVDGARSLFAINAIRMSF